MLDALRPYLLDLTLPIVVVVTVLIVIRLIGREDPMDGLKRKWPAVTALVAAAIAVGVGLQIGVLRLTAPDIDDLIAGDPMLAVVMETMPEQAPAIRDRLQSAANRGNAALRREASEIGYEIGVTMMPRLIGSASDDAVLGFIDVFATNMAEAADQGGPACVSYLLGGADGGPTPSFSADASAAANEAVTRIFTEGATGKPKRALEDDIFASLLNQSVDRAFVLAGDRPLDFGAYGRLASITDDETKQRVCWAALYLHLAIRELPPADAAALYRMLMSAQ